MPSEKSVCGPFLLMLSGASTTALLELSRSPSDWDTPEYLVAEQQVLDHLGPQFFFSKAHPDRPSIAPQW